MGSLANPTRPGQRLCRLFLLLAAADTLAVAVWALARPADLFLLLGAPPSSDAVLLWRVLAGLALGHVLCLGAAAACPGPYGGLVVVPLQGRALQAGVWLWLLGSDRVRLPTRPLALLLAHDAFWVAGFLVFLGLWCRRKQEDVPPPSSTEAGRQTVRS